jgi:opacity protein-like surface antigen
MRRISWSLVLLMLAPSLAMSQTTDPAKWDVNASAGLFQGRPTDDTRGWDDWYSEGRYAASLGYYWTNHLKTELEFSTTGEGRRFTQHFVAVPGVAVNYPIGVEEFYKLRQTSARVVWQFNDNVWVHPYVNAGMVYEAEHRRQWSPSEFYYPPGDPRTVTRVPINHDLNGDRGTDHRVGFTAGGGAKFYFSPKAYINAGMQITRAKPSTTFSVLTGIGVEF